MKATKNWMKGIKIKVKCEECGETCGSVPSGESELFKEAFSRLCYEEHKRETGHQSFEIMDDVASVMTESGSTIAFNKNYNAVNIEKPLQSITISGTVKKAAKAFEQNL